MSVIKQIAWVTLILLAGLLLVQAIRLLMLKQDVTDFKQYWEKQIDQPIKPASIVYVALGDSVAQGIGASKPQKGYVGLLAKRINEDTGQQVQVVNFSVSGAKIKDVLQDQLPRLQQIELPPGSIVTLDIGANDLGAYDADTFASEMEEVFRRLPAQTVVADMPYFGGGRAKNREPDALAASKIIRKLAATYNLRVAPVHETTKTNDGFWTYGADLFHPSNRGHANWYKAFEETLYP